MRIGRTLMVLPALLLGLVVCGSAAADEALLGAWVLSEVDGQELEGEANRLTYTFGEQTVVVTLEAGGESASWELSYSVSEGELTIQPGEGLGEPTPLTLAYRVEDGVLVFEGDLLAQRPEMKLRRVGGEE